MAAWSSPTDPPSRTLLLVSLTDSLGSSVTVAVTVVKRKY